MSSHGIVRGLLDRLLATMLVTLLAGSLVPCRAGFAAARDASKSPDNGMNAPRAPAVAAAVPIAAAAMAAPLSVTPACGRRPDRIVRPAIVVKSAPNVLRI